MIVVAVVPGILAFALGLLLGRLKMISPIYDRRKALSRMYGDAWKSTKPEKSTIPGVAWQESSFDLRGGFEMQTNAEDTEDSATESRMPSPARSKVLPSARDAHIGARDSDIELGRHGTQKLRRKLPLRNKSRESARSHTSLLATSQSSPAHIASRPKRPASPPPIARYDVPALVAGSSQHYLNSHMRQGMLTGQPSSRTYVRRTRSLCAAELGKTMAVTPRPPALPKRPNTSSPSHRHGRKWRSRASQPITPRNHNSTLVPNSFLLRWDTCPESSRDNRGSSSAGLSDYDLFVPQVKKTGGQSPVGLLYAYENDVPTDSDRENKSRLSPLASSFKGKRRDGHLSSTPPHSDMSVFAKTPTRFQEFCVKSLRRKSLTPFRINGLTPRRGYGDSPGKNSTFSGAAISISDQQTSLSPASFSDDPSAPNCNRPTISLTSDPNDCRLNSVSATKREDVFGASMGETQIQPASDSMTTNGSPGSAWHRRKSTTRAAHLTVVTPAAGSKPCNMLGPLTDNQALETRRCKVRSASGSHWDVAPPTTKIQPKDLDRFAAAQLNGNIFFNDISTLAMVENPLYDRAAAAAAAATPPKSSVPPLDRDVH